MEYQKIANLIDHNTLKLKNIVPIKDVNSILKINKNG